MRGQLTQFPGGGVRDDDLDEFRCGHRVEEVQTADPLRVSGDLTDSQSEVVDGGDDRHGERGDAVDDPGADAGQCVRPAPIAQLGDVRAGSEDSLGTVASLDLATGDDEDAGIVFELVTDGVQVIDHVLVDGVADLGAVETDERVGVGGLDSQGGEGHP